MREKNQERPQLLRKINLLDSTLLVIGSVIGSGIFLTTGFIAEYLPSPGLILLVWIAGGLITLCGALSFAELGAMFPKAGGQYVYLREAYGSWAGFFYGWAFFWVIECGGIAALAVGFAEYLGYFVPSLATDSFLLEKKIFSFHYSLSTGQLIAVASILILSAVNYFGLKSGITVQNIFTGLKVSAIAALVVFGFVLGEKRGATNFEQLFTGGEVSGFELLKYLGLALIAVFWTYDGWYGVNCAAEEVKNPGKNIPLGLLFGILSITCVYFLVNLVYVSALPVEGMKGVARIGELASTQLFGDTATFFIAIIIMISIFGCLSATILYGPRVFFAMSEDRAFFRSMAYVHPRYHVPTTAILGQAVWSAILCLTGTYRDLFEYVVFALVIFFAATGMAVIVLRSRYPGKERPYRVWGYPLLPVIFVLVNIGVFLNTILAHPFQSAVGLLILFAGLPAFIYWKRKAG
ncbi:MAG: APC family permease [Candidatus Aminicenantales bacterium]